MPILTFVVGLMLGILIGAFLTYRRIFSAMKGGEKR